MNKSSQPEPISYIERLSNNVDQYIESVIDYPDVRLNEFLALQSYANLNSPQRLLEVPAEGKMLELLYPMANIDRADFLKLHLSNYAENVMLTNWDLDGIAADTYDALLAVVPFHHANAKEKQCYVTGAWQALKPGGVLAIAEVAEDSPEHHFLDGFINAHTASGHCGAYPTQAFTQVLLNHGFTDVSTTMLACPWIFHSEAELHTYLTRLFGLTTMSVETLIAALEICPGLQRKDGRIVMSWSLRYFRGVKRAHGI